MTEITVPIARQVSTPRKRPVRGTAPWWLAEARQCDRDRRPGAAAAARAQAAAAAAREA